MESIVTALDGEEINIEVLQDRMKRNPDLYEKEFKICMDELVNLLQGLRDNPAGENKKFMVYIKFLSHISHAYRAVIDYMPNELITILEQYYSVLNPATRLCITQSLIMMRNKNLIAANMLLPILFKLFRCKDKELRVLLYTTIISDLKRLNTVHKNQGLNKQLQAFIYEMLQDPNDLAAKKSLQVMIELYKKKIWNDTKTVNVIASACLGQSNKQVAIACRFFMNLNYNEEDDESENEDEERVKLLTRKGVKLHKKKKKEVERTIKLMERKEKRKSKVVFHSDFLPIDLINDPQGFCEKLFAHLRKSNEKFELKFLIMHLIARLIGRHKLIMLSFYPFIMRYINNHQKEIDEVFAMVAESCHDLVPPEEIKVLVNQIIDNFISDRCSAENITRGINTVREISQRMPLALDESQLEYLQLYRNYKNKSVVIAAKALINLFRDINPKMLLKKYRGSKYQELKEANETKDVVYGENKVNHDIDGIDLLKKTLRVEDDVKLSHDRILDNDDFKRIKILKIRQAMEKVDKNVSVSYQSDKLTKNIKNTTDLEENVEDQEDENESEEEEGEDQENDDNQEEISDDEDKISFESGDEDLEIESMDEEEFFAEEPPIIFNKNSKVKAKEENFDVDSDEMKEFNENEDSDDTENDNPHNVVDTTMINTFKRPKKERIAELQKSQRDNKEAARKGKKKPNGKTGGGLNTREQMKNKPLSMVMPKRQKEIKEKYKSVKERIKNLKTRLGKVRKGKIKVKRTRLIN